MQISLPDDLLAQQAGSGFAANLAKYTNGLPLFNALDGESNEDGYSGQKATFVGLALCAIVAEKMGCKYDFQPYHDKKFGKLDVILPSSELSVRIISTWDDVEAADVIYVGLYDVNTKEELNSTTKKSWLAVAEGIVIFFSPEGLSGEKILSSLKAKNGITNGSPDF